MEREIRYILKRQNKELKGEKIRATGLRGMKFRGKDRYLVQKNPLKKC